MLKSIPILLAVWTFPAFAGWEVFQDDQTWEVETVLEIRHATDSIEILCAGPNGEKEWISGVNRMVFKEPDTVSPKDAMQEIQKMIGKPETGTRGEIKKYWGTGNEVIGPLQFNVGLLRVDYRGNGRGVFIARVLDSNGQLVDLIASDQAPTSGQSAVSLPEPGSYFFAVQTGAGWWLNIEIPPKTK